jgi:hypothetical protein
MIYLKILSYIPFNQFNRLIRANMHTFSTTGTLFGSIDKGNGFSLNNSGFQSIMPANPHATPAITAIFFYHIGN